MQLVTTQDQSPEAKKLSKLLSRGGYSDDFTPFFSRNLFIADVDSKGPITQQNIHFAGDAIIRNLPEPYSTYLSPSFIKTTAPSRHEFQIFDGEEGLKHLFQLLSEGGCLHHTYYFRMVADSLKAFWKPFLRYFGEPSYVLFPTDLYKRGFGDLNFLLIRQEKAAFFSHFTTD